MLRALTFVVQQCIITLHCPCFGFASLAGAESLSRKIAQNKNLSISGLKPVKWQSRRRKKEKHHNRLHSFQWVEEKEGREEEATFHDFQPCSEVLICSSISAPYEHFPWLFSLVLSFFLSLSLSLTFSLSPISSTLSPKCGYEKISQNCVGLFEVSTHTFFSSRNK